MDLHSYRFSSPGNTLPPGSCKARHRMDVFVLSPDEVPAVRHMDPILIIEFIHALKMA